MKALERMEKVERPDDAEGDRFFVSRRDRKRKRCFVGEGAFDGLRSEHAFFRHIV